MGLNVFQKRFGCFLVSGCLFWAASSVAAAENKPAVKAEIPVPAPEPKPHELSEVSPITQAAVKAGVLACTSRVNQISSFLIKDNQSGAFLFTTPDRPDHHVFSTSMEIRPPHISAIYATASFVPNPDGGCDAVYDTVEYVAQACADIGKQNFKGTASGLLKKDILVYNTGDVKYFLMPAGQGCLVIKKEILK